MSSIRAAVIREKSGPFSVEELQLGAPAADEVVVRIVGVGICHTDLACRDQHLPVPLPCVFGHEGAGVVEEVGALVSRVKPGDHVVLSSLACGTCPSCLQGRPTYCFNGFSHNILGTRLDGTSALSCQGDVVHGHFFQQSSFASRAIAKEANTIVVDRTVPLDLLGPLGCGLLTGAGSVINSLKPPAGSTIAIFGAGAVGLAAVMAAALVGCSTIVAVDLVASRLEIARTLGATHTVKADDTDAVAAIREITGGGANFALDCTGVPKVLRQAVDSLAIAGVCGAVGLAPAGTEVAIDMNGLLFGRTVRGILMGDSVPHLFIPQLIEFYKQGRFPFDRLIRFYDLEDIQQAVHDTETGVTIKAVLRPQGRV